MIRWITIAMLVGWVAAANAQSMQPQGFSFYRCACNPSSVGSTTTTIPGSTTTTTTTTGLTGWSGSVYATSDSEANLKAQTACTAETRGSLFNCSQCLCTR